MEGGEENLVNLKPCVRDCKLLTDTLTDTITDTIKDSHTGALRKKDDQLPHTYPPTAEELLRDSRSSDGGHVFFAGRMS